MSRVEGVLKRLFDLFFSFFGLLFLFPVFIIVGFLVKIETKGPVLFFQKRLGKDGREFVIYKFRTMIVNAENKGDGLFVFSAKDKRITKVGKVLRRTSIDELPQLINVLIGNMSIIGPRPPVPYHPYEFSDYSMFEVKRFELRPGITGYAQVKLRNSASWQERIIYDIYYLEHYSIMLDIKILFLTLSSVLSTKNVIISGTNRKKLEYLKENENEK